jgi:hypothetical protein
MYCGNCGSKNDDNAYNCLKCRQVLQQTGGSKKPHQRIPNYFALSIFITFFCCLPLGIPAILYSAQVNGKIQAGDIQGAMESSRRAKMWCLLSFGVGLVAIILFFLYRFGTGKGVAL